MDTAAGGDIVYTISAQMCICAQCAAFDPPLCNDQSMLCGVLTYFVWPRSCNSR